MENITVKRQFPFGEFILTTTHNNLFSPSSYGENFQQNVKRIMSGLTSKKKDEMAKLDNRYWTVLDNSRWTISGYGSSDGTIFINRHTKTRGVTVSNFTYNIKGYFVGRHISLFQETSLYYISIDKDISRSYGIANLKPEIVSPFLKGKLIYRPNYNKFIYRYGKDRYEKMGFGDGKSSISIFPYQEILWGFYICIQDDKGRI
jgi:hypothetical protein